MSGLLRARSLPGIGTLLNQPAYARLREEYPHPLLVAAMREQVEAERQAGPVAAEDRPFLVEQRLRAWTGPRLRRVINGTGVVLHTNLGRAPLASAAAAAAALIAQGYSNLELDLDTGRRGERASLVSGLLTRLTGAEAGLVVNNNAAAVLLALSALCAGREVIVSRGQLVEIGGSFRMPDVMRLSRARMVEVGTTNRTRIADFEEAINERTAALLRVHTSNFQVTGFTESASLEEMARLARARRVLLLDDLGSGSLAEADEEPSVKVSAGLADVALFSGDKLLGGPQAGIAIGRVDLLKRMARHPLARALRVDKLTLAALEVTLRQRLLGRAQELPSERMLAADPETLRRRAAWWGVRLAERGVNTRLLAASSVAGGGSMPGRSLPTFLLCLEGRGSRLARALRQGDPPVLARVEAGLCCLDPRTVLPGEDEALIEAVLAAVVQKAG